MRRVLVTGAGSGIGQATAMLLGEQGHAVLATDIQEASLEPVAAAGADVVASDLSRPDGRARLLATLDAGPPPGGLVNAAGRILVRPIGEVSVEDFRSVFATNAESTFFLCQAMGPRMTAGGSIVNFSSPSAKFVATTEAAVYAATKAAISQITRSFAMAYADRPGGPIRVNALSPGITDTPMQLGGPGRGLALAWHRPRRAGAGAAGDRAHASDRPAGGDGRLGPVAAVRRIALHDRPGAQRGWWDGDVVSDATAFGEPGRTMPDIDRSIPVVDAHHHVTEPSRNPYAWLTEDGAVYTGYLGDYELARADWPMERLLREFHGANVVGSVHVEAAWSGTDPVDETRYLAGSRSGPGGRTGTSCCVT